MRKYTVSIRGPIPADIISKVSAALAEAVKARGKKDLNKKAAP